MLVSQTLGESGAAVNCDDLKNGPGTTTENEDERYHAEPGEREANLLRQGDASHEKNAARDPTYGQ